ncbi:MAG: hypothetical protein HOV79_18425 [Hamadaea sp.]|nr:hypothetical protein [Hamadaea sp.]
MSRTLRRTLTVAAAASALALGVADGARAGDDPGGGGSDWICAITTGVQACFVEHGDHVWVQDTLGDGNHARGRVVDDQDDWATPWCINYGGYGTWKHCDFDVVEGDNAWIRAARWEGSRQLNSMESLIINT